jgi:hypothetical protein
MTTIWKYTLMGSNPVEIKVPEGAKILCAQSQFDDPTIWVKVDPMAPMEKRAFAVIGTGHEIPQVIDDNIKAYIGTVQTDGGNFIFHVFELNSLP